MNVPRCEAKCSITFFFGSVYVRILAISTAKSVEVGARQRGTYEVHEVDTRPTLSTVDANWLFS